MHKSVLERFIAKYNLSGAAEAVQWRADEEGLKINFISENRDVVGFIHTPNILLAHGTYSIFETAKLRSLLSVLKDDINLEVNFFVDAKITTSTPIAFRMKDDSVKVVFALSDSSIIPAVPKTKTLPDPDIIFEVNARFREAFIKAKSALPDEETFAVYSDGKTVTVTLGYDPNMNRSNVSIDITPVKVTEMKPVFLSSTYMKEILQANKEMPDCVMDVSHVGLGHLYFVNDQFQADYYLNQQQKK